MKLGAVTVLVFVGCSSKLTCGGGGHVDRGECVPDHTDDADDSGADPEPDTADTEPITYERVSCSEDATTVIVGGAAEVTGDACDGRDRFALRSLSCEFEIGTANVSPCDGPIGTTHVVVVRLNPPWDYRADRVSLSLSGPMGEQEINLSPDSADSRLYKAEFTPEAPEGARRLGVALWSTETNDTGVSDS